MKFFKPRDKEKNEKLTEILLAVDGKKSESSSFTITIIKMDIYEATAFRHLMTGNKNCISEGGKIAEVSPMITVGCAWGYIEDHSAACWRLRWPP